MYFRDAEDVRLSRAPISARPSRPTCPRSGRCFRRDLRAAYTRVPTAGGALTYDAIRLLAHVIRAEGSAEPARIRTGLRNVGRFEGVTGIMVFEGRSDPLKSAVIVRASGGEYHFTTIVSP